MDKKLSRKRQNLINWLNSPLGKNFIKLEKLAIEDYFSDIYSFDTLAIAEQGFITCIDKLKYTNCFVVNNTNKINSSDNNINPINSLEYKLPLPEHSMDLVYLAHSLEFSNNPHDMLREVYRVLKPEGYLIISSFNPISLWGGLSLLFKYSSAAPWSGKFISKIKLNDWLNLLGFNIIKQKNYCYNLPINTAKYIDYTKFVDWIAYKLQIPCSNSFLTIATKKNIPITPIKLKFDDKQNIKERAFSGIPSPELNNK